MDATVAGVDGRSIPAPMVRWWVAAKQDRRRVGIRLTVLQSYEAL
jgi:hypothetical protein